MLSPSRIFREGKTEYPWEREAVDFLKSVLPDTDPYHLAALFEMSDGQSARLYEVDAVVVGYSAIYLIEIKSQPGRIEGDSHEWWWTRDAVSRTRYMDNPYRLTNHKAKVLKGLLQRGMKTQCPRVEPLVFLSAPDVVFKPHKDSGGEIGVVDRTSVERAITRGEYPGSYVGGMSAAQRPKISRPVLHELLQSMRKQPALRERKGETFANAYQLLEVVSDGPGYQERHAKHRDIEGVERIARVYSVPDQIDSARKKQLRDAAQREFKLLHDLRGHQGILRAVDYAADAQVGPTIVFDTFEDAQPLDAFLRRNPDLNLLDRLRIVVRVGLALAYAHRRSVIHGSVGPHAVLVRRDAEGALETRLTSFQLGASDSTSGTHHWSALASPEWGVYQAPDLRESPERTTSVDMYGLGALAYFVITDKAPAADGPAAYARIIREKCLDPRLIKDDLPERVVDLVTSATRLSPAERESDVETWTAILDVELQALANPSLSNPESDPLEAAPDSLLGEYHVRRILGQGATAKVLDVENLNTGAQQAMKVALESRHDERLRDEAAELQRLRHPRIVEYQGQITMGGRFALLLSLAGTTTLQKSLETDGVPTLDRAFRYGDDLLDALVHLEERGILHRDLKPANLGVGTTGKDRYGLTLFDFSLARAPLDDLEVGTTVYRDPHLIHRKRWDAAADRWSAAFTLHELLTGARPHFGGRSALDDDATPHLSAERFDAHVRATLTPFFLKALARDVADRFSDAEEMRRAFRDAIDAKSLRPEAPTAAIQSIDHAAIEESTAIAALPLSTLAKNALDRAGLERAADLLTLPDNRISSLRNVGRSVQREILQFRGRWASAHGHDLSKSRAQDPFFAEYRGADHPLSDLVLSAELKSILNTAGLRSLASVAAAPKSQLERLATRHHADLAPLTSLLHSHNRASHNRASHDRASHDRASHDRASGDTERPSTIDGWLQALLPETKAHKHARALFGLDGPLAQRIDASVRELATALGLTPPAIYIALTKSRAAWREHPEFPELVGDVRGLLDQAAGALPLETMARRLLDRDGYPATDRARLVEAAALIRVVAECDDELVLFREGSGPFFVLADIELAQPLRILGDAADALSGREPLPGPGEAARSLRDVLEKHHEAASKSAARDDASESAPKTPKPFATLEPAALVSLAVAASTRAALSPRLEIYPKDMNAELALAYSISMLPAELTVDHLLELMTKRYPEALPLPQRPALDALMARHEYKPREVTQDKIPGYGRQGEPSSGHTRNDVTLNSLVSQQDRTTLDLPPAPGEATSKSAGVRAKAGRALRAGESEALADFDEAVRLAIELRTFRVLTVSPERLGDVARAVLLSTRARLVTLDRLLADQMMIEAAALKIPDLSRLHLADLGGPERQGDWSNLKKLAQRAMAALLPTLIPEVPDEDPSANTPLLLVSPGLLARYDLDDALTELLDRARRPTTPATFLLLPAASSQGSVPLIGPHKPIPNLHSGQVIAVPARFARPSALSAPSP